MVRAFRDLRSLLDLFDTREYENDYECRWASYHLQARNLDKLKRPEVPAIDLTVSDDEMVDEATDDAEDRAQKEKRNRIRKRRRQRILAKQEFLGYRDWIPKEHPTEDPYVLTNSFWQS